MQLGFGFSSNPPLDRGFGLDDMASILDSLMVGLGFEGYASQGGDIGSILTRILSVKYDSVKAANVNYLPLAPSSGAEHPFEGLTERENTNAKKAAPFASDGRGYAVMHATRPSTIGSEWACSSRRSPLLTISCISCCAKLSYSTASVAGREDVCLVRLGRSSHHGSYSRYRHDVVDPGLFPKRYLGLFRHPIRRRRTLAGSIALHEQTVRLLQLRRRNRFGSRVMGSRDRQSRLLQLSRKGEPCSCG